jgi:hypothetical protein
VIPIPFTCSPSNIVRDDPRARAIEAAATDDSYDARQHSQPSIKFACPRADCAALPNHRCMIDRQYVRTHAEREALVPEITYADACENVSPEDAEYDDLTSAQCVRYEAVRFAQHRSHADAMSAALSEMS